MTRPDRVKFGYMDRKKAALQAYVSRQKVLDMDLPEPLQSEVFDTITDNVEKRRRNGFETNPTSSEEVMGLVFAAMNGYSHITDVRNEVARFAVAYLQTDAKALRQVREYAPPVEAISNGGHNEY